MNAVVTDLWPILMTAIIGVIIGYARYVHNLKERVAVLENKIDDLKAELDNLKNSIYKDIENIQKRMDSHSKKQDDILEKMSSMEKEILKQMGKVTSDISALASDLRGLSNLLAVSDIGIKVNRAGRHISNLKSQSSKNFGMALCQRERSSLRIEI